MWKRSHQKSAFAARKLRTSCRPKLKISVPQSWCAPCRGSSCSYKRRAVEARQRPGITREMRRHPVHDHADARVVQRIDQKLKILRRAVPAGRRVETRDLVAPGRIEGVLGHRQELDVREAEVGGRS